VPVRGADLKVQADTTRGVTRRRLLLAGTSAASAFVLTRLMRRSLRRPAEGPLASEKDFPVALVGCDSYRREALRESLERGFQLAPPPDVQGKRILLKPNFVEYAPERPVTTHVELIRETVRAFRERGAAEVVIAEGPGHNPDTDEVWFRSGLYRVGAEEGARVVDLNVDDLVLTRMRTFPEGNGFKGRALERLFLPKTLFDVDLIVSMPKLKTHHWAGVTLGMKNLFGVVPSVKYGWPKNLLHVNGIVRSIVELAATIPVAYTIVDGIEGMEGNGPIVGTSVPSHCLLFGRSVYAVDWVATQVMGLEPAKLPVIALASGTGFGPLADPRMAGESLKALQRSFVLPPQFDVLRT
jgi:uncharacterized protein (DUF362 family)